MIKKENYVFVGEIKGLKSNVKNSHIAQLNVNTQKYKDKIQEISQKEKICSLLIINSQRDKDVKDREPVNTEQIELAKRNGSLIIETETLLKIFEKYKGNELTTEYIIKVIANEIGLLKIENFDKYDK